MSYLLLLSLCAGSKNEVPAQQGFSHQEPIIAFKMFLECIVDSKPKHLSKSTSLLGLQERKEIMIKCINRLLLIQTQLYTAHFQWSICFLTQGRFTNVIIIIIIVINSMYYLTSKVNLLAKECDRHRTRM